MSRPETLLVLSNLPDAEHARRIAALLVERRLAACVNLLPGCESVYRWQGRIETAREVTLLAKAPASAYPALEAALREAHPYELPEIIAVPVTHGLPAYLQWVLDQTADPPT